MQHVCRVAEGDIGDVLGIAGYLAGTAFFGLWFVEQSRRSDAEVELALCRSKLDDLRAEVGREGGHACGCVACMSCMHVASCSACLLHPCWLSIAAVVPPAGWCPWLWISVDKV